jgi:pyruvate/2-oxoacid:ferredoxin oxidoreductase beta subunit
MKRRHHTPEQIVRKLREADRLLGEGSSMVEVCESCQESWRVNPLRGLLHVKNFSLFTGTA